MVDHPSYGFLMIATVAESSEVHSVHSMSVSEIHANTTNVAKKAGYSLTNLGATLSFKLAVRHQQCHGGTDMPSDPSRDSEVGQ